MGFSQWSFGFTGFEVQKTNAAFIVSNVIQKYTEAKTCNSVVVEASSCFLFDVLILVSLVYYFYTFLWAITLFVYV